MKLLIKDTFMAISGLTKFELNSITERFTYKDMSKAMTRGGFDKRKVKKVKFAISKNGNIIMRTGFLQEFVHYCKELRFKITEVKDDRTKFPHQKEYDKKELRKYFNPDFDYVEHQMRALRMLLKTNTGIIKAPTSAGKCFGRDTEVLMYDGSVKLVQDIVENDIIMGWDSKPRTVLKTTTGSDTLYKIKYLRSGGSHIVNSSHILTLKASRDLNKSIKKDTVIDIELKEYLKQTKDFKRVMKLFQEPVLSWNEKVHKIDPYFLGVWLGDGRSNSPSITSIDEEIISYLYDYVENFDGLSISVYEQKDRVNNYALTGNRKIKNPITEELVNLEVLNNKHIPREFLVDSYENRLGLLSGLIDTDGYLDRKRNIFEFENKNKELSEGVVFLAKSLGFYASISEVEKKSQRGTVGKYYSVYIAGDIWKVPTKIKRKQARKRIKNKHALKDPTKIGFEVIELEQDNYYGFTLDGDGRFMLGDFVVSHNTEIIIALMKMTQVPTLILVDSVSLANQTMERIDEANIPVGICHGKGKIIARNMVSTILSVKKLSLTDYKMVIVDECHIAGAKTFQDFFERTSFPLRFGFSATPDGNDKYRFATIRQHIGGVIAEIFTKELMDNDVITKPEIHFKSISCIPTLDWQAAYDANIVNNVDRNRLAAELANESGVPTLVLYKIIEHGKKLKELIPDSILLSGENSIEEREDAIHKFKKGEVRVLIASNIFKQGISINNIQTLINASGGKSKIEVLQKIGRALRKHPGKDVALVYDFLDIGNEFTHTHSLQRMRLYRETGFDDIIEE